MNNHLSGKRVFVSGGAGVIGTSLVSRLLEEGAEVFVGDLKPCPKAWIGKIKYRQGDLNTITAQELTSFDPHLFFHLAATFERTEETPSFLEENFHHNVRLSHHLLLCLKHTPSLERVVFASSYLIYDPSLYEFNQPQIKPIPLTEDSPIYPRNICGAAKLFHELELRFFEHNSTLPANTTLVSARIFRVYGCGSRDIISHWIRAALRHEPLTVYRPEGTFDYIFADDVAEGLLRLAKSACRGIVNLGTGHSRSVADLIQILRRHFPDLKTHAVDSTIPYEFSQASVERLVALTDWRPTHTLESAIPKLIAYEKANLASPPPPATHPAVLITSISKKMPLIDAVRAAADKLGQFQKIHGCDSDSSCIGQYGVDAFWHCPSLPELTPDQIISYCRDNGITAIIPTRDADLAFYSRHRPLFQKQEIHILISPLDTITTCQDKKQFADLLMKEHLPAIPTFLSLAECSASRYVVKERNGAGSQQIGLALTKEHALEHSHHLKQPIFQPYIEGQEWSIDLFRTLDGHVKGCVARKRDFIVGGESQVTTTARHPALEQLCHTLADKLDIHGHAVFQVIEDAQGGFHVVECNPRFGGASTASLAVGLDSFFWFFAECLGLSLHDYPFFRSPGEVRQIRCAADRLVLWPEEGRR